MGSQMALGVADPVPPLKAPTVSRQLRQPFWCCAEAGEKEVFGLEGRSFPGSCPVVATATIQLVRCHAFSVRSGAQDQEGSGNGSRC